MKFVFQFLFPFVDYSSETMNATGEGLDVRIGDSKNIFNFPQI